MVKPIRIAIFEDNKDFRESLSLLIETNISFSLCGAYENASRLERRVEESHPDVILMDINMPGTSGIEAVSTIKRRFPHIQVLMQTVFEEEDKIFASLCAGASGYILKNTPPEKIIQAIQEVALGGTFFTPSIAAKVLGFFKQQEVKTECIQLTPREKQILLWLVKGCSYKMIAAKLEISYETVHSHMKKIYEKLHVNSIGEAVAKAINQKLV